MKRMLKLTKQNAEFWQLMHQHSQTEQASQLRSLSKGRARLFYITHFNLNSRNSSHLS